MKKTLTINISGSVFHIDEDAYEKLQAYLQKLNRHFSEEDGGTEILQDIEARIAELFLEKMDGGKDVINDAWVEEVMERMGKPEDFLEAEGVDEEEQGKKQGGTTSSAGKVRRRMYRDPDSRIIAGVCSGMGAYFGIDPVILRIVFVLLLIFGSGTGLIAYIVFWIAVPKARTTAQKLEMRGEEANITNIEKSIREEVKEVKASYERMRQSPAYEKSRAGVSRVGDFIYNLMKVVFRVVVVVTGVLLTIGGFVGLVAFLASLVFGGSVLQEAPWMTGMHPELHIPGFFNHFVSPGLAAVWLIAIGFLAGIPLLAILFIGSKLIFRYRSNNRLIGLGALGVWLLALVVVVGVSISQVNSFSKRNSATISTEINCNNCSTLYLELGKDAYQSYTDFGFDLERMKAISKDGVNLLLGEPRLDVEKSSGDQFLVVVRKRARGSSTADAQTNLEKIEYQFTQADSVVKFDPYFTLGENARWRKQEVDITVRVPVGKSIYLDEEMIRIIYDIDNVNNIWDGDMVGKYWVMTEDGLKQAE